MAIGWLSVLKSVPWEEVISNAPKVAEGAKKLWKSVSHKPRRKRELTVCFVCPADKACRRVQTPFCSLLSAANSLSRSLAMRADQSQPV